MLVERKTAVALGVACAAGATALWLLRSRKRPLPSGHSSTTLEGDRCRVLQDGLDLQELVDFVGDPGAGAIASFSGVTRDNFQGKKVQRLEYEGFPPMATKEMQAICAQIRERWDVRRVAMDHRLGVCPIGEASVIIVVSSAHRREALEAVHFAIDALKSSVPIWKKEFYDDGDPKWKENAEWQGGVRLKPS